jgi:hypothetical protein
LLRAYYFGGLFAGRHNVAPEFWATADADGVLESGHFFPFGAPSSPRDPRPHCLFFLQAELDALLSEPKKSKKSLPDSKKPALVAALGRLDKLTNRAAQVKALRELPEFEPYHITDRIFREACRTGPRRPGVKQKRD